MKKDKGNVWPKRKRPAVGAFILLFAAIFLCLNLFFAQKETPFSVWGLIEEGNGPQILILGSSHANKSFIPTIIEEATGKSTAVLSSNNQYMEIATANLVSLLKYYTPEIVVLEAYTPFINTKETIAASEVYKNSDGITNLFYRAQNLASSARFEDVPGGMFPILRSYERFDRFGSKAKAEENLFSGSDIKGFLFNITSYAQGDPNAHELSLRYKTEYENPSYAPEMQEESSTALRKFLDICKEKKIEVWIVKTPTVLFSFAPRMKELEDFTKDYENVTYIDDYHLHAEEMNLVQGDFYDPGHLSRRGAVKFTTLFTKKAAKLLGTEADFDKVFFYKGESIVPVGEKLWRYTMEAFGEDVLYRFEYLNEDGSYSVLKDFGSQNHVDSHVAPKDAGKIRVTIKTKTMKSEDVKKQGLFLEFMTQNSAVLR